jgi:hypothetical protein
MSVTPLTLWANDLAASMAHKLWEVTVLPVQKIIPLSGNDFHDSRLAPAAFLNWRFAPPLGIIAREIGKFRKSMIQ